MERFRKQVYWEIHCERPGLFIPENVAQPVTRVEDARLSTTHALDDRFDDAERGLEWLEKIETLQARSASDQAAYEVAEYVMRLRTAVTELAGDIEALLRIVRCLGPGRRRCGRIGGKFHCGDRA